MSDDSVDMLPEEGTQSVLLEVPEQRMPPTLAIKKGMTVVVLKTATKNDEKFAYVRFKEGSLPHWISASCVQLPLEEAAA